MMHYVEDDNDLHALTPTLGEPIVPKIPVASEVTNPSQPQVPPQASVEASGTISHPPVGRENLSQQSQEITPPPLLSKLRAYLRIPERVRASSLRAWCVREIFHILIQSSRLQGPLSPVLSSEPRLVQQLLLLLLLLL
ncbi:hypothetical protein ACFX14_040601 [Malus domestica]